MQAGTAVCSARPDKTSDQARKLGEILASRIRRLEQANQRLSRSLRLATRGGIGASVTCLAIAVWMGLWSWQEACDVRREMTSALGQVRVARPAAPQEPSTANHAVLSLPDLEHARSSGQQPPRTESSAFTNAQTDHPPDGDPQEILTIGDSIVVGDLRIQLVEARIARRVITEFFGIKAFESTAVLELRIRTENISNSETMSTDSLYTDGIADHCAITLRDDRRNIYQVTDSRPERGATASALAPGESRLVVMTFPRPRQVAENLLLTFACKEEGDATISFRIPVSGINVDLPGA